MSLYMIYIIKNQIFTFNVDVTSPVFVFHILIVLSPDPLTTVYPSGENATPLTTSICPLKYLFN